MTVEATNEPRSILDRQLWLAFVLPMAVYLAVGAIEPSLSQGDEAPHWPAISFRHYPLIYGAKIALSAAAVAFVFPRWRKFPFRVSVWAVPVGVAGFGLWIGLCRLGLEPQWLGKLGLGRLVDFAARPGYNPFEQLAGSTWLVWSFVAFRFVGLAVLVPLVEEFFLRGFLMRFVVRPDWWNVPIGQLSAAAIAVSLVYPILSHPGSEWFAAVAWFSLITAILARTKNIWDCVAAHAVTNLLLGVYVVISGEWRLM